MAEAEVFSAIGGSMRIPRVWCPVCGSKIQPADILVRCPKCGDPLEKVAVDRREWEQGVTGEALR